MRTALYGAARVMLVRSKMKCDLRDWGLRLAATKGHKRAAIACARKMAVLMHKMWVTGQDFKAQSDAV